MVTLTETPKPGSVFADTYSMTNPTTTTTHERPQMVRIKRASGAVVMWELDGELYDTPIITPLTPVRPRNPAPDFGSSKMRKTVAWANGSEVVYVWTEKGWDVESTKARSGPRGTCSVEYNYDTRVAGIY